MGVKMDIE